MIILYSNGCPKCSILKKKLDMAHIDYLIESDTNKMIVLGLDALPVLKVDNDFMNFTTAVNWINKRSGNL